MKIDSRINLSLLFLYDFLYVKPRVVPSAELWEVNQVSLEEYDPEPPKCISVNMEYSKSMGLRENGLTAFCLQVSDIPGAWIL